ncbi:hypothetical protein [Methylocystis iwaonis]|uniref:Uncharacterized protein n=1 Tax=Methylocystis iwaonis TaxID=2885079 RepID=A0ABM8E5A8_9HYPH|nr:hypothetical protein [Methylocystis iwaonis]BDV33149.1 hypothetical protein SS37A_06780 [Methylocystis iwaonis]
MSRSLATAAQIIFIFLALADRCVAGEKPSGFDFCAPPSRPLCIDAPVAEDACDAQVQAFIKTVFRYRECLDKETQRAVREANDVLEAWKCRTGALTCR